MAEQTENTPWRMQELTAIERARSLEAFRRIARGEVRFPFCCGHCMSPSVAVEHRPSGIESDRLVTQREVLVCLSCSRETSMRTAHVIRKQQMAAYIRQGVDIDVTHTPTTPQRGPQHGAHAQADQGADRGPGGRDQEGARHAG